jgi:hypothetical protein
VLEAVRIRPDETNQETDDGKKCVTPYKGLGADSEEKHEPVSDIDIAAADSLKVA